MQANNPDKPSFIQVDKFHYNIDSIKKGGMATVYLLSRNSDLSFNDPIYKNAIAVKVFDESFKKEFISNELNIWIQMNHKNILPLLKIVNINYKIGALMPMCFFSIQDFIDKNGIISIPQALNILLQIANALNYAYLNFNILHLDLKPANMLCRTRNDRLENCVLSDWGIATIQIKTCSSKTIGSKNFLKDYSSIFSNYGTLPFMAPERFFVNCQATIQCDIYSLGLILFQFLSGNLPFLPTENEIAYQIVSGEYFFTATQCIAKNKIPVNIAKIIVNCISPNISNRYDGYKPLIKDIVRNIKQFS
jgi:Serine/threonine protein kinase